METNISQGPVPESLSASSLERPRYETPTIKEMSEADILSSFQLTQSMVGWWGALSH